MRVQIIVPPCRKVPTGYPPYGALYIATYLKNSGHTVNILNLDLLRPSLDKTLNLIESFRPDVIGFSAIVSTSYGHVKEISNSIKERFPEIFMILGGQLSNAAETLLKNTPIDVVIIGEGEKTAAKLLYCLKNGKNLDQVRGIAFKKNGQIILTPPTEQFKNLDDLPFPDFELIDMNSYLLDPFERWAPFMKHIDKLEPRFRDPTRRGQKTFTILTGRGCPGRCTFCCRNIKGIRKHSPGYILDLIELLKERYNVGFFTFGDESFISNKKWTQKFLDEMKKRNLDILFYVLGARVDTVDKDLLRSLKEAGCFMIEYGFESGSQRMLDMMEKRNTVAENFRAYQWTREVGLHTVPSNVINMPGETEETIGETIQFLKSLKMENPQLFINYAQAHPGTPLYNYALLAGLIKNEDEYLLNLTDLEAGDYKENLRRGAFLNFSGQPLSKVSLWRQRIYEEVYLDYAIRKEGFYLIKIFKYYIKPKINAFFRKISQEGFFNVIRSRYYYPAVVLKSLFSSRKDVSSTGDRSKTLKQIDLEDEELIKKIKKGQFSSRETSKHPLNPFIEVYTDSYNGYSIIRYSSLRKVCQNIENQNS